MRRGSNYYPPNESRRVRPPGGFIAAFPSHGAQEPSVLEAQSLAARSRLRGASGSAWQAPLTLPADRFCLFAARVYYLQRAVLWSL